MNLKNCKECGKVYVHPTRDVCQDCYNDEEHDFEIVKEYLWDKSHAAVDEVSEKTGVKKKRVVKFIRQGRITAEGLTVELYLHCESCGERITEGRYCQDCRDKLIQGLSENMQETPRQEEKPEYKKDARMHIDRRNRD